MRRALEKRTYRFRSLKKSVKFHGLDVPVTGDHVSMIVWKMLLRGTYEAPELSALRAILQNSDTVLELGAGMGVVSSVAAKAHPTIHIESYEANPAMIPVIKDLHARNDITNVTLHNMLLLPDTSETPRTFHVAASFAESSLIKGDMDGKSSVQVPQKDIRTVLSKLKPDVILCDIEGAEAEVFPGLDLTGVRAIVLELHPAKISRSAQAEIYDSIAAQGLYPRIELCSGTVVAFERVSR